MLAGNGVREGNIGCHEESLDIFSRFRNGLNGSISDLDFRSAKRTQLFDSLLNCHLDILPETTKLERNQVSQHDVIVKGETTWLSVEYPKFDDKLEKVVTLTVAINDCLKANSEKPWGLKKGKMADLEAYFATVSTEAGKKVHIVIQSEAAAKAYEAGKKAYYSQRGYLKLSCATCHVQGTGKRVRNEYMSPLLGHTTHFPVYRLKWQGLGTLERRIEGCNKDEGENPHKVGSVWMSNVLYFMAYMSNEMPIDGPAIRK